MAGIILFRQRFALHLILVFFAVLFSIFYFSVEVHAAVRTWDGGGTDGTCGGVAGDGNKWSCAANWSANTTPTSSDTVVFDATSTKAATIDAGFAGTVLGMTVSTGYTNTITQARTFTVGTSGYSQADGVFAGATQAITVNGNFALSGTAAFTATSGTFTWAGPSAGSGTWTMTGTSTFAHNSGTLSVTGTRPLSLDVVTSITVNALTINRTSATTANRVLTVASGDTIITAGTLTLTDGFVNTGTIDARVNISQATGFDGGTGFIDFGDNGVAQTYTLNGAGVAPIIRLDAAADAADSIILAAASTPTLGLSVTSGFSGTVPITNGSNVTLTLSSLTQAAGTLSGVGQSAWNISGAMTLTGGTFTPPTLITATSSATTWDVATTQPFTNLTLNKTAGVALTIASGDTLVITGALTLTEGSVNTGIIDTRGNISQASTYDGGTGIVDFGDNAVSQTYTVNGGVMPNLRFDAAADASDSVVINAAATIGLIITSGFSGAVPISNPSNFTLSLASLTQDAGTLDVSAGGAANITGSLTLTGGTLTLPATVTVSGAAATWDVTSSLTITNLIINKNSGVALTVASGDTVIVTGDLTLTNGRLNTGTIEAQGNVFPGASFDGGTGTINVTGAVVRTITLVANGIMPGLNVSGAGVTVSGQATGTAFFENTFTMSNGVYTGGAGNIDFVGLTLSSPAVFTAPTGFLDIEGTMTVNNPAAFVHSSSIVYADCGAASFVGDMTLYDFYADCQSTGEHIQVGSGSTLTLAHLMQVYGNTVNMTIESVTPGVAANINVQGSAFVYNAKIKDIHATGSLIECLSGCTDQGGNSNIRFGEPGYLITDDYTNTTEAGGTISFNVSLLGEPLSSVDITVASSDLTEGTVSPATLTFTSVNYATPQTVTVTGVNDAVDDGGVAYSIILGVTTSDTAYAALNPTDLTVVNADDDEDAGNTGFDLRSAYTMEDVKDSSSPAALWFVANDGITPDFGRANLLDGSGGTPVNVTAAGSKIQAGCTVVLSGGDEYVIQSVNDYAGYGFNITVTDPNYDPLDFESVVTPSGAVSAIYCTQMTGDAFQLSRKPVLTQMTRATLPANSFFGLSNILFDSVNNKIWANNDRNDEIYMLDAATGSYTSTIATGNQGSSGEGQRTALDTSSNAIWVLNDTAGTVTKINAATGAYFNGTLGASSFTTGSSTPTAIAFDSVHNDLWIGHTGGSPEIRRMETDGTLIGSITLSGTDDISVMFYDPVDDALWVGGYFMNPITGVNHYEVSKLNASTGAYFNGTRVNSTALAPMFQLKSMVFDSVRNAVWVIDLVGNPGGVLEKIDADSMEILATYPFGGSEPTSIVFDSVRDVLLITDDLTDLLTEIDPDTGIVLNEYTVGSEPLGVAVDTQGDVWVLENDIGYVTQNIVYGVPFNQYYSLTTTDSSQVDASSWSTIDSLTLTDDDDGQDLFYSISFDDRHTFSVFTGGAWRPVASDLASVHGGTDGVWYYRDNASAWAVASSSAATRAISQAVSGNANNQMVTATLTGLTSSDWSLAGGFQSGVTTALDFGIALKTADPRDPPMVDEALFAFSLASSGSSGSGGISFVSGGSISINAGNDCAPEQSVILNFSASGASSMMVSTLSDFSDGAWESFTDSKSFMLTPPDGVKTVYVKFRSSSGNVTGAFMDAITLDEALQCVSPVVVPPPPGPVVDPLPIFPPVAPPPVEPPVDEPAEEEPTAPATEPNLDSFVTAQMAGTSYYIMPSGELRPIPDAATSASYIGSCASFTSVPDETLTGPVGSPLFPKAGTTLVKFADSPRVYAVIDDGAVSGSAVLRWVVNEDIAILNFGTNWAEYILTLSADADFVYTLGADITELDQTFDRSHFVRRALLTKAVTYDAYIINPDGTQRFTSSWWAKVTQSVDGTSVYGFEDKGSDADYNDVVLDVDSRSCLEAKLSVRPLDSAWHHQIGLLIYYEDQLQTNMVLWPDSHAAVGQEMTIDLSSLRVK